MENVMCPHCGSNSLKIAVDDTNIKKTYHCNNCKSIFTDDDIVYCDECGDQVIESERIDYNGMIFCSKDCAENHKKNR